MLKHSYLALLFIFFSDIGHAVEIDSHPKLRDVVDQLISEQHYSREQLVKVFAQAEVQQSVLDAMMNPAEYTMTWGKYRNIFIQPDRIQQGADFWLQYQHALTRAEQEYGVPASMIVAIIGVESKYGQYKGRHKVLDSLVSLVTGYQRRSEFFARELKEFLILTKENNLPAAEIFGSYAGAVGFPQFISSSYRAYAVDFSGDGVVDLINQPIDAIGSVANYFVKNGWLAGQPVTSVEHQSLPTAVLEKANNKRQVQYSARSLRALDAPIGEAVKDHEMLGVVMLNASTSVPTKGQSRTVIVRAGDTVCEIAEANKVPCRKLREQNKLDKKGSIYRGQRLTIPASSGQASSTSSASAAGEQDSSVQPRYFFTHENFYVITRYNQSVLYAMAVHDLASAIAVAKIQKDSISKGDN